MTRTRVVLMLGAALAVAGLAALPAQAKPITGQPITGQPNRGGGGPSGTEFSGTFLFNTLYTGNDCAGALGKSFAACALNDAPILAKYDVDTKRWEVNTALFPGLSAEDFSVVLGADGRSGSFTYRPDAGDPELAGFVLKAGNFFQGFRPGDGQAGGEITWRIDWGRGLSHISFFGLAAPAPEAPPTPAPTPFPVPEPATMALLATGLLGLGLAWRRRRR